MDDTSKLNVVANTVAAASNSNIVNAVNNAANAYNTLTSNTYALPDEVDFDAYADEELSRLLDDLQKKNTFLDAENKLFESYLLRVSPNTLRGNAASAGFDAFDGVDSKEDGKGGKGNASNKANALETKDKDLAAGGKREKKKKGEKTKEVDKPILLTPEQKSEIATRELEELRDEIEKQKDEWGKIIDNFKAEMEEIDIRVAEIKKAMYEFKRDVVQQAVNPRTGKVIAERIVRYFEDKIRAKEAIIEKVRLKNATLKVQKNKLHLQLKQKEEMGEVLHAIDFDQLQIENKQYLAKIEERNAELIKLKLTAGNTIQTLNFYKRKLQNLTTESEKLYMEIGQRKELLAKLTAEAQVVDADKSKAEQSFKQFKEQIQDYRVPHVMDYVQVKAQQQELVRKLKTWERKVEIATMQAHRVKSIWNSMCAHGQMKQIRATVKQQQQHPLQKVPYLSTY